MNSNSKAAACTSVVTLMIVGHSTMACAQVQYPIQQTIDRQTPEIKNKLFVEQVGAGGNSNFIRSSKKIEFNITNPNSAPISSISTEKCEKSNRFIECDNGQYRSMRIFGCLHYIDTTNSQVIERLEYPKIGAPEIKIHYSLTSNDYTFKFENTLQLQRITSAQEIGWDIPGPVLVYEWHSRQALNNSQQMQTGASNNLFYSTHLNCILDDFKKMANITGQGSIKYQATIEYRTTEGSTKSVSREVTHTFP